MIGRLSGFRGTFINEKFFDIKKDKQNRIINAGLKVFAEHGYRHASTDEIVKEADISKGLLFHYFGSKIGTYTFLHEYSVRYMILEYNSYVSGKETDPFVIIAQIEQAKLEAMKSHPYMITFLESCEREVVSEPLLATEESKNMLREVTYNLTENMNFSMIRKDCDVPKLLEIISYTIDGLRKKSFSEGSFQADMLYADIVTYLEMIRLLSCNY